MPTVLSKMRRPTIDGPPCREEDAYGLYQKFLLIVALKLRDCDTPEKRMECCENALALFTSFQPHINYLLNEKKIKQAQIDHTLYIICQTAALTLSENKTSVESMRKAKQYSEIALLINPTEIKFYSIICMAIRLMHPENFTPMLKDFFFEYIKKNNDPQIKSLIAQYLLPKHTFSKYTEEEIQLFCDSFSPTNLIALFAKLQYLNEKKDFNAALAVGKKLLSLIDNKNLSGSIFFGEKDTETILTFIKKEAVFLLGNTCYYAVLFLQQLDNRTHFIKEAIKYKHEALRLNPTLLGLCEDIAVLHFKNPNATEADKSEMIRFYKKSAEEGKSISAHHQLAFMYSNGLKTPKDLALAKTHITSCIQLLLENNKLEKHRIFSIFHLHYTIYDKIDCLAETIELLKQSAEKNIPYAGYFLAKVLLELKDYNAAEEALIRLVKDKASHNSLFFRLYGEFLGFLKPNPTDQDIAEAVSYLKKSIELDNSIESLQLLYKLHALKRPVSLTRKEIEFFIDDMLEEMGDNPDPRILELDQNCFLEEAIEDILSGRENREFAKIQTEIKHIVEVYNTPDKAEEGIIQLLETFKQIIDFQNASTLFYNISVLFATAPYITDNTKEQMLETFSKDISILELFTAEISVSGVKKQNGSLICQIFKSLSVLKFSPDHASINKLFEHLCQITLERQGLNNISEVYLILILHYASRLLPCKHFKMNELIQEIINELAQRNMGLHTSHQPLLLQTLAMLHYCDKNDILQLSIPEEFIQNIMSSTLSKIDKNASIFSCNQAFLGLSYFKNIELNGLITVIDKKRFAFLKQKQKQALKNNPNAGSRLQARVFNACKASYGANVKSEHLIGISPVDIFLENENVAIQVNGPYHYLNNDNEVVFCASNRFSDHIIRSTEPGVQIIQLGFEEINPLDDAALKTTIQEKVRDCCSIRAHIQESGNIIGINNSDNTTPVIANTSEKRLQTANTRK